MYSDFEKDILRFTEQWTLQTRVDPALSLRLHQAMSPQELVILAATVAQANFTCRFNNTFGIELP